MTNSIDDPVMDAQSKAYLSAVDALAESLAAYWAKGEWPGDPSFMPTYPAAPSQCARCGEFEAEGWMHLCADVVAKMNAIPPIITPFGPITPMPPPGRFVKRGGWEICTQCTLVRDYCGCDKQAAPDAPPKDGADSSLERRARECMGGR